VAGKLDVTADLTAAARRMPAPWTPSRLILPVVMALTALLAFFQDLVPWASRYPSGWVIRVDRFLTRAIKWLINDADFGFFSFKELTRAVGAVLDAPVLFLKGLLVTGFEMSTGAQTSIVMPPVSWLGVMVVFVLLAAATRDRRLVMFVALSFLYVAFIGLWDSTMLTFASIIVAVLIGVAAGVALGVAAYRSAAVNRVLTPIFDFMQTMPVFAYLVPALMLFGYGPSSALVITLIYALPPMARVTTVALEQVADEIAEFGRMAGCTRRQLMRKVLLPSIRSRLMLGVNQVIMLTLNMVIIASMIGAGGLGYDVWQALKALRVGQGAEAGIAITLVAIVLDRISQRYAARRPRHGDRRLPFIVRHKFLVAGIAAALVTTILSLWVPSLAAVPDAWTFSTGRFWDNVVGWINVNLADVIGFVRDTTYIYLLKPVKSFMLSLPWLGVVLTVAAIGLRLGGMKLALVAGSLVALIAVVGMWEKAAVSAYLVGVCVFVASLLGIAIGILAARHDRFHAAVQIAIDTLQTLPAFVYLIPVIMLFGVGDFAAMVAVTLYAIVPAIRYTDHGIRQVPGELVEASRAMGCTHMQVLKRVQLPLALPDIMLGVNQTLMMGLSMLVITALVGTRDLGQETLIALSKVDPGLGLTAGICVAFIAIAADRLIHAWAQIKRRELGLAGAGGAR
jgi:glycine betaine/proline transport system permease protein